ncbi:RNA methyltransferase [uncultured Kocuria sp.]|uniref:TrmH family RNA methyltransferase n=1 Tax=uncultured Kocuria sp. TaxID=259305 RepID=UPI0025951A3A|nr:RNA methyltransferase [uncultured Kocuria sp.]MCT1367914.1 RNA methyltransferase [Rothia sp. p3-SID1597]
MVDIIDSLSRERTLINPTADRVKDVASLARPRTRSKKGLFMVEGPQGVREALAAHRVMPLLDALYVTERALERHDDLAEAIAEAVGSAAPSANGSSRKLFIRLVTEEVLEAMSDAQTPQGVLAIAHQDPSLRADPWSDGATPGFLAALVRVQDPGNAGTLIRAADAAGADGVVTTQGSVDVLNPKAVRSTAGSLFHLPVTLGMEIHELVGRARATGMQILAADGYGDHDVDDLSDQAAADRASGAPIRDEALDLRRPTLWLFGNEAQGLTRQEKLFADARVAVPVYGSAESLNVSTAATVCLYASARARRP